MTRREGILLVARREIVERVRSRVYLVSTLVMVAAVLAAVVVPALMGPAGPRSVTVGLVGDRSAALATQLVDAGPAADLRLTTRRLTDAEGARLAVDRGQVDVALVDGAGIIARGSLDPLVGALVNRVVAVDSIRSALETHGVPGADAARLGNPAPLPVTLVAPTDRTAEARKAAALVAIVILDFGLLLYGTGIATGVVEEKATHVVETLLACLRPRQLLTGKIVGVGIVGLAQLGVVVTVGGAAALIAGQARVPAEVLSVIPWLVLWMLLGFALYAAAFAAVGALVSRQEELSAAITPVTILIVATYLVGNAAAESPSSPLFRILSVIPPLSPMLMPVRGTLGVVTWWEAALAVLLMLAAVYGVVRAAARVYARGLLSTASRMSLRVALRGGH